MLTALVLGPLVALGLTFVVTPSYASQMQMFVSSVGATANDRLQNLEYSKTRVSSYAQLVDSPLVLNAVRRNMGLPPDGPPLVAKIEATNPLETSIIVVTVHDSSPERAQQVARQIGQVFNSIANQVEHTDDGAGDPLRVTVIAPPPALSVRESPSHLLYISLGIVGGLALGLILAVAREMHAASRQRRWRERLGSSMTPQAAGGVPAPAANGRPASTMPRESTPPGNGNAQWPAPPPTKPRASSGPQQFSPQFPRPHPSSPKQAAPADNRPMRPRSPVPSPNGGEPRPPRSPAPSRPNGAEPRSLQGSGPASASSDAQARIMTADVDAPTVSGLAPASDVDASSTPSATTTSDTDVTTTSDTDVTTASDATTASDTDATTAADATTASDPSAAWDTDATSDPDAPAVPDRTDLTATRKSDARDPAHRN